MGEAASGPSRGKRRDASSESDAGPPSAQLAAGPQVSRARRIDVAGALAGRSMLHTRVSGGLGLPGSG